MTKLRGGAETLAESGLCYKAKSEAKTGLNKVSPHIEDIREFSKNLRFSGGIKKVTYDKLWINRPS